MPRQRNQARNPEKFTPRIRATPVRRPIAASSPIVLKLNGFFGSPETLATMLCATTFPSRDACCAVGVPEFFFENSAAFIEERFPMRGKFRANGERVQP